MPLILSLAVPGSHYRFLRCRTRLPCASQPHPYVPKIRAITEARLQCLALAQPCSRAYFTRRQCRPIGASGSNSYTTPYHSDDYRRSYASSNALPETRQDIFASILGIDFAGEVGETTVEESERLAGYSDGFIPPPSRRTRKRLRSSQAAMVLESIHNESRNLYWSSGGNKLDHSYVSPAPKRGRRQHGGKLRRNSRPRAADNTRHPTEGPASLYTVLSHQLHVLTKSPWAESRITHQESALLKCKGYNEEDVHLWVRCLVASDSVHACAVFKQDHNRTPLFLLLLYLRRIRIRASALGMVMRHLDTRLRAEPIEWTSLQVLVIRLMRHARLVWPEALPWVASLFCAEVTRMYHQEKKNASYSTTFQSSLTRYCNSMLSLISLPSSEHPVLVGFHQEKAQFIVLQFMASCEPALTVTRYGFQGAVRTQLTHVKTAQEKEWARLKGPSWPPWKENRTAMDEDKSYMFGVSRASRLLHRLYEAGYGGRGWEKIAEVYAGWDTDLSPTVQTRTLMPQTPRKKDSSLSKAQLWTARIRTTRTRREAWACFLAYEESNTGGSSEVYLAMFEKLHFPEVEVKQYENGDSQPGRTNGSLGTNLLPGDMKEVLPDPKSPLHLVYLSEPVPSLSQLYQRMRHKRLWPKKRLLAFLLETLPDFSTCLNLLEATQDHFDGGVRMLIQGSLSSDKALSSIPDYFIVSFIRFLCRFGRFGQTAPDQPIQLSPEDHVQRLKLDRTYLIDYAYALLMHLCPTYRPAWTAFMQKLLYGYGKKKTAEKQYTIMCRLFDKLSEIDLDPDDEQFQLLCAVARYATETAHKGKLSADSTNRILGSAPPLLRTTFHNLVGANVDSRFATPPGSALDTLPPHVPGPAVLQAYVRALGFLRDYEGLYSFSIWLATYHKEVTVRVNAQRGGPQLLYNTLVALRASLEGTLDSKKVDEGAPQEITELAKAQIEGVRGWHWPSEEHVHTYVGKQSN